MQTDLSGPPSGLIASVGTDSPLTGAAQLSWMASGGPADRGTDVCSGSDGTRWLYGLIDHSFPEIHVVSNTKL